MVAQVRAALDELWNTEREYLVALDTLVDEYIPRLRELIAADDASVLFGNVEIIHGVNRQLLAELAAARSAPKLSEEVLAVATAFQTLLPFLKLYALYCSGYFAALETLERVKTERPPVASAVAAAETALAVHRQGEGDLRLASCLIRPVKRLCLYPLLLASLIKEIEAETASSEPQVDDESGGGNGGAARHPAHLQLAAALQEVLRMANQVNEMVRLAENRLRLTEVHERLRGAYPDLIAPTRRFLLEARVTALKAHAAAARCARPSHPGAPPPSTPPSQ